MQVVQLQKTPAFEVASLSSCEVNANTSEPMLTGQATMELILAEIKSVASRVNDMDESVGARLDIIDGALSEIKVSVSSVESSLSVLSNRVADLEKRME